MFMRLGFDRTISMLIRLKWDGSVSPNLVERIRETHPKYDPVSDFISSFDFHYTIGLGDKPAVLGRRIVDMTVCDWPLEKIESYPSADPDMAWTFSHPLPELSEALTDHGGG
ncbi:hypothetical protein [Rhodospirillum sp. A1_3_36]|uniref:hypothetical protein n=1 Tax=Rhodospirillum sp. A1_3_36 TaxID=3391666 RepID=UPI0039A6712D